MKGASIRPVLVGLILGVMAACGGGGGDGVSAAGMYSGVATQATVTPSNATALSADAYENGNVGTTANVAGAVMQGSGDTSPSSPLILEVGTLLKGSVAKAARQQKAQPVAAGVIVQRIIEGSYSGSASFTLDINRATGSFIGALVFNSLKDTAAGPEISGTVNISGVYDEVADKFESLVISFAPLSGTTTIGTFKLYGTMVFAATGTTETLTVSCTLQNSSGTICWIKDWTYTYSSNGTLTIVGRYYHRTHGYVDITTPIPLSANTISGRPTAGVLLFCGANGTKARITFTATGYIVAVDAAGNGDFVDLP